MRHNLARAMVLAACVLAACDSGGNAAPDTLGTTPPTATLPPATTGTSAALTVPATTPVDDGTIALSPDGPWRRVDSAPGVTLPGLVYELMPGLWVWLPVEEDIPNGITWVLNEADLPVIEAYLQARLVFYSAIAANPMDFSSEGWTKFYVDGGERLHGKFAPLGEQGFVADMSAGVVLRPAVAGEGRTDTEAMVLDCTLDGAVMRGKDGSLAPGSTAGILESGVAATFGLDGTTWKLDRIAGEVDVACS